MNTNITYVNTQDKICREWVRIIKTPPGDAPRWVRSSWVGLSLKVKPGAAVDRLVIGKLPKITRSPGYVVNACHAFARLRAIYPKAADWWIARVPLDTSLELLFPNQCCTKI